jgi:hypothetical protein
MFPDTKLIFYLMNERTNDHFSLPNGHTIEVTHDTVKTYSFNNDNCYEPLPDVDLSYLYLHFDLETIANDYLAEINKEYQLDSMKLGKINIDVNKLK